MGIFSHRGNYSCFLLQLLLFLLLLYSSFEGRSKNNTKSQIMQELRTSLFATQIDLILGPSFLSMFQLVDAPGK